MLGALIVLLALLSVAFAAHSLGSTRCDANSETAQQTYNASVVVGALGVLCATCGLFLVASGWNPFTSFQQQRIPPA